MWEIAQFLIIVTCLTPPLPFSYSSTRRIIYNMKFYDAPWSFTHNKQ